MKVCNKCKIEKSEEDFSSDISKKDGLRTICRDCDKLTTSTEEYKARARLRKHISRRTNPAENMYRLAKTRAKKNNLPFDIQISDIKIPEFCPILGLRLVINDGTVKSDSMSLDRIVPEKGYTVGNIQVISQLANTMKSSATLEQLEKFAKWVLEVFKPMLESQPSR